MTRGRFLDGCQTLPVDSCSVGPQPTNPHQNRTLNVFQIKQEVEVALQSRLDVLRSRATENKQALESLLWRVTAEGLDLTAEDLVFWDLAPLLAEVRALQSLREFLQSIE